MESNPRATSVPPGRETALYRFIAQLPIEQQERTLHSMIALTGVATVAALVLAHGIADHLAHKLHEKLSGGLLAFALLLLLQLPPSIRQRRPEVLTIICLFVILGAVVRGASTKALWVVSDPKGHFVLLLTIASTLAGPGPSRDDGVPPQLVFSTAAVFGVYGLLVYYAPSLLPGLFSAFILYMHGGAHTPRPEAVPFRQMPRQYFCCVVYANIYSAGRDCMPNITWQGFVASLKTILRCVGSL